MMNVGMNKICISHDYVNDMLRHKTIEILNNIFEELKVG